MSRLLHRVEDKSIRYIKTYKRKTSHNTIKYLRRDIKNIGDTKELGHNKNILFYFML